MSSTQAARNVWPAARAPEQPDVALGRAAPERVGRVEGVERQVGAGDRLRHVGRPLGRRERALVMIRAAARVARRIPVGRGVRLAVPSATARSIEAMCGRYTVTNSHAKLVADRFGVLEQAVPAETLGRFNVCPTETVLGVCGEDGGPARAPAALGSRAAVGAHARRRSRADQRPPGDAPRQAAVRAARRRRRHALPRRRRRLVRVAAPRAPARRAGPVPLQRRRRRAVRVRGAVALDARGRRAAGLGDGADHDGERDLRPRARSHAVRARLTRGRGRVALARGRRRGRARAARAARRGAHDRRARRTPPSTARAWRGRSCSPRRRRPSRLS